MVCHLLPFAKVGQPRFKPFFLPKLFSWWFGLFFVYQNVLSSIYGTKLVEIHTKMFIHTFIQSDELQRSEKNSFKQKSA